RSQSPRRHHEHEKNLEGLSARQGGRSGEAESEMDGWRNRELISNICDQSEPRIARMTRMGCTEFLSLPTALMACGPFASFAQFAAQILVAATQRCATTIVKVHASPPAARCIAVVLPPGRHLEDLEDLVDCSARHAMAVGY